MTTYPVVEHGESRVGRWVHERRFRLALFIGLVETVLVLANGLGWFWILAAAIAAVAFHIVAGRQSRFHAVREISWIAATSQLIAFLIPLLWELVKFLAITILVLLALALLAILLLDRRV
jgi:hypothetical protein